MFEDDFMAIQSDMIALCLELCGSVKVDKVYHYVYHNGSSSFISSFFLYQGKLIGFNDITDNRDLVRHFLHVCREDAHRVIKLCEKNNKPIPKEMKLIYDVDTDHLDTNYTYVDSNDTVIEESPNILFQNWKEEIQSKIG